MGEYLVLHPGFLKGLKIPHSKYQELETGKVGRDPQISLLEEGVEGLNRLGGIADGLLLRQGGCTGCKLSGSCGTCMPLVTLFRKAKAPLANYCQHTEERN